MNRVFFIFSLFAFSKLLGAVKLQSRVEPTSFGLNETAYLTIVADKNLPNVSFDLPQSDNFRLHYESQSSQTRYVNGVIDRSVTWFFRISPEKTGEFLIPSFACHSEGTTYMVPETKFSVIDSPASSQNSAQNTEIFLTLSGNFPKKWYVGQSCPLQIQLLTPPDIRGQLSSFPQKLGDNFSATHLIDAPQKTTVDVQKSTFACLYWPTLITAQQSGQFSLAFSLDLEIEQKARPSRLFDDDPLALLTQGFGGIFAQKTPLSLKTRQRIIDILPLPTPQPPHFSNAIGNFQLLTPQPLEQEFIQNEPFSFSVKISGQGNFANIKPPHLVFDSNVWRIYDPSSNFEEKDSLGYSGELTFKYMLVPLKDRQLTLPKVEFCFFDNMQGKYETLVRSAVADIHVKPAIHTIQNPLPTTPSKEKIAEQLPHYSILIDGIIWENKSSCFWWIQAVVGILFLSFLLFAIRHHLICHNAHYRSKKDYKNQSFMLKKSLIRAFKKSDGVAFYDAMHGILDLFLKKSALTFSDFLNRNTLSKEQKDLWESIENKYQESKFGHKVYDCPQELSPYQKLIKTLK